MRGANITASAAVAVWVGLLWLGIDLLKGVIAQKAAGYPAAGQVDFLVGIPLKVLATLLIVMAAVNLSNRAALGLLIVAVAAFFGVLPYMFFYGGGV